MLRSSSAVVVWVRTSCCAVERTSQGRECPDPEANLRHPWGYAFQAWGCEPLPGPSSGPPPSTIRDCSLCSRGLCFAHGCFRYGAVPDRWGVAMMHIEPITLATLAGLIVGLMVGAIVAGLVCMERQRFSLRLPEDLHRRLSEAARDHMWSLKAEIVGRLEASFDQPSITECIGPPTAGDPVLKDNALQDNRLIGCAAGSIAASRCKLYASKNWGTFMQTNCPPKIRLATHELRSRLYG